MSVPRGKYITNDLVWSDSKPSEWLESFGKIKAIECLKPINKSNSTVDTNRIHIDNCKFEFSANESPITTAEITIDGVASKAFLESLFYGRSCHGRFDDGIKKIYVNEKKKTVVVVFNGKFHIHNKDYDPKKDDIYHKRTYTNKIKVKCNSEEVFDIYKAVSAACMIKSYGSNSAFKSHIRKMVGVYSDSLYDVMARYLTGVMFGSWNEFIKAVDKAREDIHGRKETNTK